MSDFNFELIGANRPSDRKVLFNGEELDFVTGTSFTMNADGNPELYIKLHPEFTKVICDADNTVLQVGDRKFIVMEIDEEEKNILSPNKFQVAFDDMESILEEEEDSDTPLIFNNNFGLLSDIKYDPSSDNQFMMDILTKILNGLGISEEQLNDESDSCEIQPIACSSSIRGANSNICFYDQYSFMPTDVEPTSFKEQYQTGVECNIIDGQTGEVLMNGTTISPITSAKPYYSYDEAFALLKE